jgi:hypothetical protein
MKNISALFLAIMLVLSTSVRAAEGFPANDSTFLSTLQDRLPSGKEMKESFDRVLDASRVELSTMSEYAKEHYVAATALLVVTVLGWEGTKAVVSKVACKETEK